MSQVPLRPLGAGTEDVSLRGPSGVDARPDEWISWFSEYTGGRYSASNEVQHFLQSTSIIKKLFEDKQVGKVGLQYLVAWSIYRQLAEFTEPYLFRGDRKADEACYVHVKNVMNLAILSHYFQLLPRLAGLFTAVMLVSGLNHLHGHFRVFLLPHVLRTLVVLRCRRVARTHRVLCAFRVHRDAFHCARLSRGRHEIPVGHASMACTANRPVVESPHDGWHNRDTDVVTVGRKSHGDSSHLVGAHATD
ncbi:hypothetical protein HPB52_006133 [Rhipicephalus sanguineus]|uniref:Uncharacterized protein n=1 Tax=Rhipicephalus sanguineus TaxID=34632 RepID=A0A9D4PXC2_RHISA|nr:hypothetical protein HPB52_006133 [Rhipicephalus sanguineus]